MRSRRLLTFGATAIFLALAFLIGGALLRELYRRDRLGRIGYELPQPVAWGTGIRVLILGDSRVAALRPWTDGERAYKPVGFSGATSAQVLALAGSLLDRERPQMLVLQVGANDAVASSVSKSDRERIRRQFVSNLRLLRELGQSRGIVVHVLPIIPPGTPSLADRFLGRGGTNTATLELNEAIGSIVDASSPAWPWRQETKNPAEYQRDYLHLSEAGMLVFREAISARCRNH